ncbi:hypothetical protein SAMN05421805_10438 [Saccharopolyspora antimicrobica]|uniref:Uncharacterized protein n=1 Tax=Saccharopolyspora antimicrobica TaxID=455193 RepID=A0A1I4Y8U1_9PSEU|nr:hypothetical protein [Saccharopolyspora antimicrobica]RKT82572.1 hypothetical protein ATL45_0823 [Saccharopolyspora antimicrobica]SFN34461.1 hypothetical protein SAMN05421805_10438 [Saccharopolyspora antimicrobica]
MRIRTDDEIYRVDAVWLGPPRATFPWRARYVAWGVGIVVFLIVLGVERRMNIGFGFFSTAWAVVITVVLTRIICAKIGHERPLGAVMTMWLRELTAPRAKSSGAGGAASAARIRVQAQRPRPKPKSAGRRKAPKQQAQRGRPQQQRQQQPQRPVRSGKPAARSTVSSRRARSKEVRGVRSPARP